VGKLADLTVLEHNLFEIPGDAIAETKVDLTLVGGKVVFRRTEGE
jgi:predicted amidohydrolase YtcJ